MGKVALVTGGGRGIGRAFAHSLAAEGYDVAVMARTESQLAQVAREIEAAGPRSLIIAGDVGEESQAESAVKQTVKELGSLDLLVNNAGVFRTARLAETSTQMWQEVVATNLTAAFLMTRAAAAVMVEAGSGGTIVNVSSVAGKKGFPGSGAYCASKFGLVGFSEAIREELRADDIRVVTVCPGQVDTVAWDTCGLDLEQLGIDRSTMMQPPQVADAVVSAIERGGTAVPEELVLRPPCGDG